MKENKEIEKANEELEYLTGDDAVRRIAFLREKAERDYISNMSGAREEGAKKAKIEIAKAMLAEGKKKTKIIKITGLTEEEMEEIIKSK